ncbi:MAG TPA: ImmA/IrrE family metallo-endopeptidase [Methanosarcinaceae archaeon]|nr:ImmA/IrrE family metallo-endopeptidase [Methanosarcinaceae archaeon]
MNESIPVNPDIMRWARETAGYSIEGLVDKIKRKRVTATVVQDWENGNASPSYPQLEKLAYKIFKRPLALFFFPEPPEEETPGQSFRTLPYQEIDLIQPTMHHLIRKAMVFRENLKELYDNMNPAKQKIFIDFEIKSSDPVSNVAKDVRKYLDSSLDEQYALKSNEDALKYWRNLLEEHGIFIFKDAFKDDEFSGFCLYDNVYPIIYINNSQAKSRQIFTLFHELAHIMFRTGGVDLRHDDFVQGMSGDNKYIEIFCNKFAGEFLVPSEDVQKHLRNKSIDNKLLASLAKKYSVSREVILRKCLDLGYIGQAFYESKVREWKTESPKNKKTSSGDDYYSNKNTYLGNRYIETVFSKYYQGVISKSQLSDYLGIKESNVPKFEDKLLSRS